MWTWPGGYREEPSRQGPLATEGNKMRTSQGTRYSPLAHPPHPSVGGQSLGRPSCSRARGDRYDWEKQSLIKGNLHSCSLPGSMGLHPTGFQLECNIKDCSVMAPSSGTEQGHPEAGHWPSGASVTSPAT